MISKKQNKIAKDGINNLTTAKTGLDNLAFTLVELIVVITILAILGTIAFISLQGYSAQARDSNRLTDIGTMKSGLELFQIDAGKYPIPTNGIDITYSGSVLWNQGTFGESVVKTLSKINKIPLDPLYDNEYSYSVTNNKNEYQIGTILELGEISYIKNNFVDEGYAIESKSYKGLLVGNYNGKELLFSIGNKKVKLGLSSIMLSDSAESIIDLNKPISLVLNGKNNIPLSYGGKGISMTGTTVNIPKLLQTELGIYYAYPSSLNYDTNQWNLTNVTNDFNQYDLIVLGEGLEETGHPDHDNTVTILSNYNGNSYGYITANQSIANIESEIDLWDATGVDGVFIDEAGYDFLVPVTASNNIDARTHQNEIIDYIHSKGLKVIFNGWDVDDIFGTISGETPTHLLKTDGYLFESFVYNVNATPTYDYNNQIEKIAKIKNYQEIYNFDLHCVGMLPLNSDINTAEVNKILELSRGVCNSIQITNSNFSVSGADNGKMINFINN